MTCNNATDPAERASLALDREKYRSEFRRRTLETFLLYLFTYEMPIEQVRKLLEKVEGQSLRSFEDLRHAGVRAGIAKELCARLAYIEQSWVDKKFPAERTSDLGPQASDSDPDLGREPPATGREPSAPFTNIRITSAVHAAQLHRMDEEQARSDALLAERLRNFASCCSSLWGDVRWLLERGLSDVVARSDREEVARLWSEAWRTLGTLEELAKSLNESLQGKEPDDDDPDDPE